VGSHGPRADRDDGFQGCRLRGGPLVAVGAAHHHLGWHLRQRPDGTTPLVTRLRTFYHWNTSCAALVVPAHRDRGLPDDAADAVRDQRTRREPGVTKPATDVRGIPDPDQPPDLTRGFHRLEPPPPCTEEALVVLETFISICGLGGGAYTVIHALQHLAPALPGRNVVPHLALARRRPALLLSGSARRWWPRRPFGACPQRPSATCASALGSWPGSWSRSPGVSCAHRYRSPLESSVWPFSSSPSRTYAHDHRGPSMTSPTYAYSNIMRSAAPVCSVDRRRCRRS